jgi:SNF2-related domain
MSLTVVCATMLAAITCQQLRKETLGSKHQDMNRILAASALGTSRQLCQWDAKENAKSVAMQLSESTLDSFPFFQELSNLSSEAVKSSIWCTCETSGTAALTERFLECKHCRVTCCRNCVGTTAGYNLTSHETSEVVISKEDHDLGRFRSKLLSLAANKSLIFTEAGISEIASIGGKNDEFRVSGLSNYKFCFHDIKRGRKKWHLIYYARENTVDEPVAEFKLTIGELKRETIAHGTVVEMGLKGELTSFLPAKTKPLVYGSLFPVATATVLEGASDISWDCKGPVSHISLIVKGEGEEDSPRVEMGLTDVAANALLEATRKGPNAKAFNEAKSRGETRRWIYPKNWKAWPSQISIEADPSLSLDDMQTRHVQVLCGTYHRSGCRQTTNQSALWIKEGTEYHNPTTYILIKPNVHRTGPDTAIVSTSISYEDASSILAVFPTTWEPCDALASSNGFKADDIQLMSRIPLEQMDCLVPASNVTVKMSVDHQISERTSLEVSGLSNDDMVLLSRRSDTKLDHMQLDVHSGQRALQTIRDFNGLCVAPILEFASQGELASALKPDAPWLPLTQLPAQSVQFGCCTKTIPPRPTEIWFLDEERGEWNRRTNERASREFYLALQAAPKPFEFWIDKPGGKLIVKIFPEVAAHIAAHQLISGRGVPLIERQLQVCYRLSDISQQSDPILKAFMVSNCDAVIPTDITLKAPYQLYQRQQRVVTKMTAIENSSTDFDELELSEHEMPGAVGLSLIARATRKRTISGGVICDAIGSGKSTYHICHCLIFLFHLRNRSTSDISFFFLAVISIGIILNGLAAARRLRHNPKRRANETGASLVVVPPALIKQWGDELKKFTEGLNVVEIYSNRSFSTITYATIMDADVIICPIDILESNDKSEDGTNGYMERVLRAAGHNIKGIPSLPAYSGQIEQSGAKGVWIPATSADPYGGANNGNNQKRRNQSAYFTHIYLSAIQSLREKTFRSNDVVPLEYFSFERVFVDEIHESLCTTKGEMKLSMEKERTAKSTTKDSKKQSKKDTEATFKEKNRRAGRELLGITQKEVLKRPLQYRRGIFGLTGTPLLDSSSRVIELANLMGNVHVCGLGHHWRQMERESSLDIFLDNYLESKQSREIRSTINAKCQDYIRVACCRNKTGEEMAGIELKEKRCAVKMADNEVEAYLRSQSGLDQAQRGFHIKPEDFDEKAGHDIQKFLRQNAALETRGDELVRICKTILSREGDAHTKIIVFTDGRIGAGLVARRALNEARLGCTFLEADDSVEVKNQKISWYQNADATDEDRKRPRVLVLHFDHAAGLNLQAESHDLVLFTPLYIGNGGATGDAVSDTSTELQAIGRLFRPGQPNPHVTVWRIEVRGNNGEECLDGQLIRRNTDKETVAMAVNGGDD